MAGITAGYKKAEMETDGGVQYNTASNTLLVQPSYRHCWDQRSYAASTGYAGAEGLLLRLRSGNSFLYLGTCAGFELEAKR